MVPYIQSIDSVDTDSEFHIVIEQIHFTIWDGWRIMYYGWMDDGF